MNQLISLSHNDFNITKNMSGHNLLSTRIRGLCLVLFFSNACINCKKLLPIFKQLPNTINGCNFAYINLSVDNNKRCVAMSQNTKVPIKYVPLLILYVDGKPYMRYTGEGNIHMIRQFIVDVYKKLMSDKMVENNEGNMHVNSNVQMGVKGTGTIIKTKSIPKYSIGVPLYGKEKDGRKYLHFDNAYNKVNGAR